MASSTRQRFFLCAHWINALNALHMGVRPAGSATLCATRQIEATEDRSLDRVALGGAARARLVWLAGNVSTDIDADHRGGSGEHEGSAAPHDCTAFSSCTM